MECEECDRIFERIRIADLEAERALILYEYREYRYNECCLAGVSRAALEEHRILKIEAMNNKNNSQAERVKAHKSLTKHYRKYHLNG